jgi:hypothetical protein
VWSVRRCVQSVGTPCVCLSSSLSRSLVSLFQLAHRRFLTSLPLTVVANYATLDNIKGDERRHRVGTVVAQAHQHIALYAHKNVVMEKYAKDTQQGKSLSLLESVKRRSLRCSFADHPEIGETPTLSEG